jgi:hypothetical protein
MMTQHTDDYHCTLNAWMNPMIRCVTTVKGSNHPTPKDAAQACSKGHRWQATSSRTFPRQQRQSVCLGLGQSKFMCIPMYWPALAVGLGSSMSGQCSWPQRAAATWGIPVGPAAQQPLANPCNTSCCTIYIYLARVSTDAALHHHACTSSTTYTPSGSGMTVPFLDLGTGTLHAFCRQYKEHSTLSHCHAAYRVLGTAQHWCRWHMWCPAKEWPVVCGAG